MPPPPNSVFSPRIISRLSTPKGAFLPLRTTPHSPLRPYLT